MTEKEEAILNQLMSILQNKKPLSQGEKIFAQDVLFHIDNYNSDGGIEGWKNWIAFLRERGSVCDLSVVCDRMIKNSDHTITALGRWVGRRNGKYVISKELSIIYRIQNDKIVEVWTTRTNYQFVFSILRYRAGLWIIYLYLLLWGRFLRKRRIRQIQV